MPEPPILHIIVISLFANRTVSESGTMKMQIQTVKAPSLPFGVSDHKVTAEIEGDWC
jgi:hypothetical protein